MSKLSVDSLSISKIGELLIEQLGEDSAEYTFPEDFEKAIVDIGFSALVTNGSSPYQEVIAIGDGLNLLPRVSPNSSVRGEWNSVRFVAYWGTEIPTFAFNRQKISSVTIPEGVTTIGANAFQQCQNLLEVIFPSTVTRIYDRAFVDCSSLQSVHIPDNVTDLSGALCFAGCHSLNNVRIPKNAVYNLSNDTTFSNSLDGCTVGPEGGDYNVQIGIGIEKISSYNFSRSNIVSVVVPDTVSFIDARAFYVCTSLTSVTIPQSVTKFGSGVFEYCASLQSVTANGVTTMNDSVFHACTSLQTVSLPELTSIPSLGNLFGAFAECTSLQSVYLPNVATIMCPNNGSYRHFNNCSSLETIQIGSVGRPVTNVSGNPFSGCTNANLTMTVYTDSNSLDTVLTNIRNGATNATIIMKAASDLVYNGTTYQAGDTILTSTPA